jgi:hypothetical protein
MQMKGLFIRRESCPLVGHALASRASFPFQDRAMRRVELPSWQDQLSDEVRELETLAHLADPSALAQARNALRTIRAFEVRVRAIALQADPLDPHARFSLPGRADGCSVAIVRIAGDRPHRPSREVNNGCGFE